MYILHIFVKKVFLAWLNERKNKNLAKDYIKL